MGFEENFGGNLMVTFKNRPAAPKFDQKSLQPCISHSFEEMKRWPK
jgi:hypothetical protein